MSGGMRTERGKRSEVATALSNCVPEGESRGLCPAIFYGLTAGLK